MKILVIDDDEDLLGITARRLTRKGVEVFCATNLTQACDHLKNQPNLTGIISDLFLAQGESGLSFYEQEIRKKFSGAFILSTGDSMADERIAQYVREDPLFSVLEKPYSIDDALDIVKKPI
jgi:DNA-binding NtrC family response regulator